MTKNEVLIKSKKTIERRKGLINILKTKSENININSLKILFEIELEIHKKHPSENLDLLIDIFDLYKIKESATLLEKIIELNYVHDLVTFKATKLFIRLTSKKSSDFKNIFKYFNFGYYSVKKGLIYAIIESEMTPNKKDLTKFLNECMDLNKYHKDEYFCNPDLRTKVAICCNLWDPKITKTFLLHCIKTGNKDLKEIAENAINKNIIGEIKIIDELYLKLSSADYIQYFEFTLKNKQTILCMQVPSNKKITKKEIAHSISFFNTTKFDFYKLTQYQIENLTTIFLDNKNDLSKFKITRNAAINLAINLYENQSKKINS